MQQEEEKRIFGLPFFLPSLKLNQNLSATELRQLDVCFWKSGSHNAFGDCDPRNCQWAQCVGYKLL